MSRETSTRRSFLEMAAAAGLTGLAGCSQIPGTNRDIEDTDGDGVIDSEDYAPRDASVQRAEQVEEADSTVTNGPETTATEPGTPTRTPAPSSFVDSFSDGDYADTWRFIEGNEPDDDSVSEADGALEHVVPQSYTNGATLRSRQTFPAEGTIRLEARIRSRTSDYWEFGFGIGSSDHGVSIREQKWESYDRFGPTGVANRPDEYASDYHAYGEQRHFAKLAPATSRTESVDYSMTLDFEAGAVVGVSRGGRQYDVSLDLRSVGDAFFLLIGNGRGHDVEYEYVRFEWE
ncbi:MAG: hypothetical protein ABEJ78_02505 [Haloferacaceae archaeon]